MDDLYVTYLISGLTQREETGKPLTMVVTLADEGEIDGKVDCCHSMRNKHTQFVCSCLSCKAELL